MEGILVWIITKTEKTIILTEEATQVNETALTTTPSDEDLQSSDSVPMLEAIPPVSVQRRYCTVSINVSCCKRQILIL